MDVDASFWWDGTPYGPAAEGVYHSEIELARSMQAIVGQGCWKGEAWHGLNPLKYCIRSATCAHASLKGDARNEEYALSKIISHLEVPADATEVTVQSTTIRLALPDELNMRWVGQHELVMQLLAAWSLVDPADIPLNPRLIGKPGVGKTTLAYAAAKLLGRDVYLFQATMDTRPEDLIISPVIAGTQEVRYVASSIVTAMLRGGIVIVDEGNRMSEKSWASLAPLLDSRRYVESIVAGVKIHAHPDFRFVATMNDDSSTFELPEYIHSRLQPQIMVDFPERQEEMLILRENMPFLQEEVLTYVADFLQRAHRADERYSVRDGINIARYALKLAKQAEIDVLAALKRSVVQVLGQEAAVYGP
jgi:MoxR-like ATPase